MSKSHYTSVFIQWPLWLWLAGLRWTDCLYEGTKQLVLRFSSAMLWGRAILCTLLDSTGFGYGQILRWLGCLVRARFVARSPFPGRSLCHYFRKPATPAESVGPIRFGLE